MHHRQLTGQMCDKTDFTCQAIPLTASPHKHLNWIPACWWYKSLTHCVPVLRHLDLNFIGPIWKFEAAGSKTEAIDVIQTLSAAYNNKLRTCGLTSISSKCNSIVFVSVSGNTWTWACSWVGWWVLCCDSFGYVWTIKITDNLSSNLQTAKHYERAAALLKLLRF